MLINPEIRIERNRELGMDFVIISSPRSNIVLPLSDAEELVQNLKSLTDSQDKIRIIEYTDNRAYIYTQLAIIKLKIKKGNEKKKYPIFLIAYLAVIKDTLDVATIYLRKKDIKRLEERIQKFEEAKQAEEKF